MKFLLLFFIVFSSHSLDIQEKFIPQSGSVTGSVSVSSTGSSTWDSANVQQYLSFGINPGSSNRLDSYEEGTWTPVDGSGAGLTFASAEGRYTKIGRIVIAQFAVVYPATADTSQASIGGLPSTIGSGAVHGGFISYTTYSSIFSLSAAPSTSLFYMYVGSGSDLGNDDLTGASVRGTIIYTE